MPEGNEEMTARERRIAELAAQDLDSWARELPLGSETRRDLQQTARVYRFAARAGASSAALQPVPDAGREEAPAGDGQSEPQSEGGRATHRLRLAEVPRALQPPLESGA